jgi:hypothetical protein
MASTSKKVLGALGSIFGGADDEEDPYAVDAEDTEDTEDTVAPVEGVVNYGRLKAQLQQQIDRLKNDRGSKVDEFLAFTSGLSRPTKTGSFGESLGYATDALAKESAERAKARAERKDMMLKYGIDLAQLDIEQQKNVLSAQARTAAVTAKELAALGKPLQGGINFYDDKTYGRMQATAYPGGVSVIQALDHPELYSPKISRAPTTGGASGTIVAPASAPQGQPTPGATPAAVSVLPPKAEPTGLPRWQDRIGDTVLGKELGYTGDAAGKFFSVRSEGPVMVPGTEGAVSTRTDPYALGGSQALNPLTRKYEYEAGQSPEDQESLLRAEARQLGVPFLPPPISKNLNPAQRGAQLRTYLADGQKAMAELKADVDTSAKMAANAQQFVSLNSRTTTGPVVGRVSSMLPPKDIQTMDSLTQSMKVVAPRTPGAISNYEDAGLAKAVPNKLADLATNTVLARRATAYNQLQQEQQGFATAWAQANGGSLFGMDDAWNRYKKANPVYDTSDPNRLAAALPNPKRQSWKEWGQQTYYKKAASAPAAAAPKGAPTVGAVKDGYRFKGGDPANAKNWEKV